MTDPVQTKPNEKPVSPNTANDAATSTTETVGTKPGQAPYSDEVRQVLDRAQRGDRTVLPHLQKVLDEHPELWRDFGDLARHVRDRLIALVAGDSLAASESVRRRMEELRKELGSSSSALEALLIDRVVVCWADAHIADLHGICKDGAGVPPDAHALRRRTAAQARYLAAIKQLAVVRTMLKPALSPLDLLRPVAETTGRRTERVPNPEAPRAKAAASN